MKLFSFFFLAFFINIFFPNHQEVVYIRCNQVGYLPGDLKSAKIFSADSLSENSFEIINQADQKNVFTGKLINLKGDINDFHFFYSADFSSLKIPGKYFIRAGNAASPVFEIGNKIYNRVVDSLMLFLKVQRCGPTNPLLHRTCHLWDVARIQDEKINRQIDVTGGWHDAGDYLKFVSTTAYTTYLLIFSFEFDNQKFGFDNDHNQVPDVLEEAKIGIDWLLRCNFAQDSLITRVQDLRDHSAKWRLPEDDSLRYDRVGITSVTKSEAGIYSAALALAARIWIEKFKSVELAKQCLNSALNIYNVKDSFPVSDVEDSLMYPDKNFYGKFELAAAELFNTTGDSTFLKEAVQYGDSAKADYWWSYGDINSLAHYILAKHVPRFEKFIEENISEFNRRMHKSVFNEGAGYSWGTTTTFLGISLQSILLSDLNTNYSGDSLSVFQRDYILGRNLWGYSFIHNIGTTFPIQQHSQVGYFNNGYLPGALSSGPAPSKLFKQYRINLKADRQNKFNYDSLQFNDIYSDFISNEPTIVGNITALFVMGYYSQR